MYITIFCIENKFRNDLSPDLVKYIVKCKEKIL